MRVSDILDQDNHRPWPMPRGMWSYYQEWNRAVFLHWQVDLEELQKFVPKELEIDLFDGQPWVSVVCFTMEQIRPKGFMAYDPISNFDEINIRTYVKRGEKTGVYFLSIEGGTWLSCKIAKAISELPYRYSNMHRSPSRFHSTNSTFYDSLIVDYTVGEPVSQKDDLDLWLTERYALFQDTPKHINQFEIHHLEWPIREIEITHLDLKYHRFSNLIKGQPNKAQYSDGVEVFAWGKIRLNRREMGKTQYQRRNT